MITTVYVLNLLVKIASVLQLPESFVQLRPRSGSVFRHIFMIYFVMRTKSKFSDNFGLPNFYSAHSAPLSDHLSKSYADFLT